LASLRLRDRDGVVTREGLIFRVFGYSHPADAFVCNAEYASSSVFTSTDPRAPRTSGGQLFYKFYDDEGLKLVFSRYPQYTFTHEMLGQKVLGVRKDDVAAVRKPDRRLQILAHELPKDELHDALQRVLRTLVHCSGLSESDFGVFGSMLHGFHHPRFSDIDLVVYGIKENKLIRETAAALYEDESSGFKNEFETPQAMEGKRWRFKNFTVKEFLWHQKRKQIYGLFDDSKSGRTIKAELEPVKAWREIKSEYDPNTKIMRRDWVRLKARITLDREAPFIPSVYGIQPLQVLSGPKTTMEATRVVSYMEEFRLQAQEDETVIVEGSLEEVVSRNRSFYQITLTYCPRYYEQVLKVERLPY
jgi:predicted nucleotidyltransferase